MTAAYIPQAHSGLARPVRFWLELKAIELTCVVTSSGEVSRGINWALLPLLLQILIQLRAV
jgi:hypothetical protein